MHVAISKHGRQFGFVIVLSDNMQVGYTCSITLMYEKGLIITKLQEIFSPQIPVTKC